MPLQVSYMGTKRQLATNVADVVASCPAGPLLDLFSGVCAVGASVSTQRQVWNNDAQVFASHVARAFFTSKGKPLTNDQIAELAEPLYQKNISKLEQRFNATLLEEQRQLLMANGEALDSFNKSIPHVGNTHHLNVERKRLEKKPNTVPYRLFSITFAGGYLGLKQCLQIDSIRYAIDSLANGSIVSEDQKNWMLLALSQAMCKSSTTSGHFAQYIKAKESNIGYFTRQRGRCIWSEWLAAAETMQPLKDEAWRSRNHVFHGDAELLLPKLKKQKLFPAVIYADPPYTEDQYSRYYHVYETLMLYDYPESTGVGRYRMNRFRSRFSLKSSVMEAFENLVTGAAALGSHLIISYPDNDLIQSTKETVGDLLKKHFRNAEVALQIPYMHSSLGNSKGIPKYAVKELVFHAY